jgi:uncharacterized protein YjbJ (UPF0337 family)
MAARLVCAFDWDESNSSSLAWIACVSRCSDRWMNSVMNKAKGAVKEGAGKLTGDKELETEGKIDKAKGSAHSAAVDVKDAARDTTDAIKK